jgi:HEAT repeat protein
MNKIRTSKAGWVLTGLAGLALAVGCAGRTAQAAQASAGVESKADLEAGLAKVASYQYGQDRAPLVQVSDAVRQAKTSAEKSEVESRLLRFLQSDATPEGKQFVCQQLSLIGTEASVSVLTGMLLVPASSDMARYALERIPGPAADAALRDALAKTSGKTRVGVINTLGRRRDSGAVQVLGTHLADPDPTTAAAAVAALGRIGTSSALGILKSGQAKAPGPLQLLIYDAILRCADQMSEAGLTTEAEAEYQALTGESAPPFVRVAALRGVVASLGPKALDLLQQAVRTGEPAVQAEAIRLMGALSGEAVTSTMIQQFPQLRPPVRVQLLAALAERGDGKARPLFLDALRDQNLQVRLAALNGLGSVGDSSCVQVLAETAAETKDEEQDAARSALSRLRGSDTDQVILSALTSAAPKVKPELIRAIGERGVRGAADILLRTAQESTGEVRREALRSLRENATLAQVPAMLQMLAAIDSAADRTEMERTLAATFKRYSEVGPTELIAAYAKADDALLRSSLLLVLGMVGRSEGMPTLQEALKSADPELKRAAILALSEWPNPEPLSALLAQAKESQNRAHQVLALRGYLRLVALNARRPPAASVALLRDALALNPQVEEKKAILALLPRYVCKESLEAAKTLRKDKAVAAEAKLAVQALEKALKQR